MKLIKYIDDWFRRRRAREGRRRLVRISILTGSGPAAISLSRRSGART
jgi:hypothetical protein